MWAEERRIIQQLTMCFCRKQAFFSESRYLPPFCTVNLALVRRSHVFDKIMNGNYSFNSKRWDLISDAGKDVVIALLQVDADERPIAEVALKLPWFANDFFANRRNTEEVQLHAVQENLEKFSKYSKIKKLALMVIAHKSSTEDIGFLRDAFAKYDIEKNGTICFEEFQAALADFGYKQDELRTMFAGVVSSYLP